MIVCGLTSLILDKDFYVILNPLAKIPFYGIMGVPISFAVVFCIVDIMNYIAAAFYSVYQRRLLETHTQVLISE